MKTRIVPFAALLVFACRAHAADIGPLDHFDIALGGYALNLDAKLRVDGQSSAGTHLDLRNDLGIGHDRSVGLASLSWRPFEHHEFSFSYYGDSNSTTRTIERDIVVDGEAIPAHAVVDSHFGVDAYDLSYTWWGWLGARSAFGLVAGVVDYDIDLHLLAHANTDTGPRDYHASARAHAPAPKIGVQYRHAFGNGWRVLASAAGFKANIADVDARVLDLRAGVEYFPTDNIGVRLQYNLNQLDGSIDKDDYRGEADLEFSGVQLQAVARF